MNRQHLILATMAAGGENASFSPVQVQKLFFLLDRDAPHLFGGQHFDFVPYDYGPFDKAVYDELEILRASGMVEINAAGRYRRYSLTRDGMNAGKEHAAKLSPPTQGFLRAIVMWVLSLSFQQLVSAIYRRYPDMKINSVFRS